MLNVNQRNIGRIGSKLTKDLKIQMVHAFIHSILDSCNSAYGAITRQQLQKLQKVQNSAVRFVYGLYGKRRQKPIKFERTSFSSCLLQNKIQDSTDGIQMYQQFITVLPQLHGIHSSNIFSSCEERQ